MTSPVYPLPPLPPMSLGAAPDAVAPNHHSQTQPATASLSSIEAAIEMARSRRNTASYAALGMLEALIRLDLIPAQHLDMAKHILEEHDDASSELFAARELEAKHWDSQQIRALTGKSPDQIVREMGWA